MFTINKDPYFLQISVAIAYFLYALLIHMLSTVDEGNMAILWSSSGFALAILVKLGRQYAIAVFFGSLAMGLYIGNPIYVSALVSLGNAVGPLFALYLLHVLPFSAKLFRLTDYLILILAGSVGAIASSIIGSSSLALAHTPLSSHYPITALYWWMEDALSIILVTPFLLLFSFKIFSHLINKQRLEIVFLVSFSILVALSVLTDWNPDLISKFNGSYLLVLPLLWSILRFGHVVSALINFLYFVIALWGLHNHQGIFIGTELQPNLILFWAYFVVLALMSQVFSYIVSERNTFAESSINSQTELYIFSADNLRFEFVNRAALNNLGFSFNEMLKLTPLYLKPLYTKHQFQTLLIPLQVNEQPYSNFETVHKRKDCSLYPVEVTIQSIIHSCQHYYFAKVTDISERLSRDEQQILGDHVCNLTPQAVLITDQNNNIIRINPAFTEMTGYLAEEVVGKNPSFLQSGRHEKSFYQSLWNTLIEYGYWKGEIFNRRKSGELYIVDMTIETIKNIDGNTQNYIAMCSDITQQREQSLHLKHLSEHDVLTDLPNRLLLLQEFHFASTSAKRNNAQLGLLFIDLNDFKMLNDRYGHNFGDEVLQVIADRMKYCVREMDMVSRLGGDEFIVLITDIENSNVYQALIDKLKAVIAKPITIQTIQVQISASIGLAQYPLQADNLNDLIKIADLAMYKDKSITKKD